MPASVASKKKPAERAPKKTVTFHYVGRRLRKERLAKKHALDDISTTLNIRKDYVKAIEANDFKRLPEEAYAIGFVRSYAKFVGLDSGQLAHEFKEDYKREHASISEDSSLQVIVPTKKPSNGILFISMVVLVVIFFGWVLGRNETVQTTAQELSENFKALLQQNEDATLPDPERVTEELPAITAVEVDATPVEMAMEEHNTGGVDATVSSAESDAPLLSPEPLPLFPAVTESR